MSPTLSLRDVTASRRGLVKRDSLPSIRYDKDGDCIEMMLSDDDFKGLRINKFLTIYMSRDTGEPVGSVLKDVVKFIRTHAPGFDLDEPFRVGDLLHYLLWATKWEQGAGREAFEKVIESTKQSGVTDTKLSCAGACT